MDIIFESGEKLYLKEKLKNPMLFIENMIGSSFHPYQKQLLEMFLDIKKKPYNFYGDDFKVEIEPCNIQDDCILRISDYDENQKLECNISIGFNKEELGQFISILTDIHKNMK